MSTTTKALEFVINAKETATGKIKSVSNSLETMQKRVSGLFKHVGMGAAGAWANAQGVLRLVQPAEDFGLALGEIANLGAGGDSLAILDRRAKVFARDFGGEAASVVRSAENIQKGFERLQGSELGRITQASNVMAKALKADGQAGTEYMAAMYRNFKGTADKMGRVEWAEQMAGQTALASQLFRTSGADVMAAATKMGTVGNRRGIDQAERLAVLGTLQMGGASSDAAASQYTAFLEGLGKAGRTLGMDFKGQNTAQILKALEGRFGKNVTGGGMARLERAFGNKEAALFVQSLVKNTDALGRSINELGQVKGMDKASEMARRLTGNMSRGSGAVQAVAASFGQTLLPTVDRLTDRFVAFMGKVDRWINMAPNVTRWVGYIVLGAMTLAGIMGLLSAAVGVAKLAFMALKIPLLALKGAMMLFQGVVWLVNAAMAANPIVWIVLGVIALTAAVIALIYYWDDLVAWFKETGWADKIISAAERLIRPFKELRQFWRETVAAFEDGRWCDVLKNALKIAFYPFVKMYEAATWLLGQAGILDGDSDIAQPHKPNPHTQSLMDEYMVPRGGLLKEVQSSVTDKGTVMSIGEQHIHVENAPESAEQMAETLLLGAS